MQKLKYKFKKVIRFINKILRVILIFGCIVSLLTFNASAAVYRENDTFFEVFTDPEGWVYDPEFGESYELTRQAFVGSTCYRFIIPDSLTSLSWADFRCFENVTNRITAGNVILFKGELMFRSNFSESNDEDSDVFVNYLIDNDVPLSFRFASDETVFEISSSTPKHGKRSYDNRYYAYYEFNIEFTIPEDFDSYTDFRLYFHLDFDHSGEPYYNKSLTSIWLGSDDIRLYVGDENNAPIYPEYDSNTPDNIGSMEDAALEDAAEGLDEVGSFINQFENIFYNGGPTVAGLQFIGMFMNDLYLQIPWLNILLVISLALGIITVILGVFNIVKKGR